MGQNPSVSHHICRTWSSEADQAENIPLSKGDAWAGLGMDGETLEAKVVSHTLVASSTPTRFKVLIHQAALEKENEELEQGMEAGIESWKKRIHEIDASG